MSPVAVASSSPLHTPAATTVASLQQQQQQHTPHARHIVHIMQRSPDVWQHTPHARHIVHMKASVRCCRRGPDPPVAFRRWALPCPSLPAHPVGVTSTARRATSAHASATYTPANQSVLLCLHDVSCWHIGWLCTASTVSTAGRAVTHQALHRIAQEHLRGRGAVRSAQV